jgi:hypothetical protein
MIERHLDVLEKLTAGIGHFDPGMMPVEQIDTQNVLKFPNALADAGLADAKRLGGSCDARQPSRPESLWPIQHSRSWKSHKMSLASWRADALLRLRDEKKRIPQNQHGHVLCNDSRSKSATHEWPIEIHNISAMRNLDRRRSTR